MGTLETNETTNDTTKVEYHPEPRDVTALGIFGRVSKHDGTLCAPKDTGTSTKQSTSEDVEALVLCVTVAQEGCNVDAVSKAAKG